MQFLRALIVISPMLGFGPKAQLEEMKAQNGPTEGNK
jgi:hypothetical protein